jgi:zinc protease
MEDAIMNKNFLILAAIMTFIAAAFAVSPGTTADAAGLKNITLPPYEEHILDNGLRVFIMETREVPLVTVRLLIPVGSAHDISGKEGIANLTARMLLKGAGGRTAEEIAEYIEGMGGNLEAEAGRDYTLVTGDFMSRDLDKALGTVGDVILRPDFPEAEHEREKSIISAEIMETRENPYYFATGRFVEALAGDHPYAHPVEGSERSIGALTRDDLVLFHGDFYSPQGAILAIVGDVNAKKALKLVKNELGAWQGAKVERKLPKLEERRFPGRRVIIIDKPDVTQSQIRIGNIAVGRNTPHYFQLDVANNILGGGFTSRLMKEIRVVRGLSYGARSILQQREAGGIFFVVTYTKNESLREAIDVALDELGKIRDVAVDDEELESNERYISGLFPFRLETNGHLAYWLTDLAFYGLGDDVVEEYRSRIDAVESGEVQEVAQKYFHKDDCLILLLTNYEGVKDQLEGLGQIEVIPFEEME